MTFAPSKPILIALAGVVGLGVVIGGVFVLRQRARPSDEIPATVQSTEIVVAPTGDLELSTTSSTEDGSVPPASPTERDSDGDGLTDLEERRIGTSTSLRDTDGDGQTDYDEVRIFGTDPLFVSATLTPTAPPVDTSASLVTTTNAVAENGDRDGDGLRDQDEVLNYKTNPDNPDTDGDGYPDGAEVEKGYNPAGPGKCTTPTCIP